MGMNQPSVEGRKARGKKTSSTSPEYKHELRRSALSLLITQCYLTQGQGVPDDIELMVTAYGYALEDIPDKHLSECFRRAIKAKRDSYVVRASEVLTQYDELKTERLTQPVVDEQRPALQGPAPDRMTWDDFRGKHNLPPQWRPGQPYPPGSDLFGRDNEAADRRAAVLGGDVRGLFRCLRCRDAGWLVDRLDPKRPVRRACPSCKAGGT